MVKCFYDEVDRNIALENHNIILDMIIENDKKIIQKINLKVLHDNDIFKIKVNDNVLLLNMPSWMIILFYNNTEIFDDKTVLSYNNENNIHLNVKCNNLNNISKMKMSMMKKIMINKNI